MDKLKSLITRRIGGVPVGAILAVVAAVALYFATRLSGGSSDEAEESAEESGEVEGDGSGLYFPSVNNPTTTIRPVVNAPMEEDEGNERWRRQSIELLISRGSSASKAQQIIDDYLNGNDLSYDDGAKLQAAITTYGLPPELPGNVGVILPKPDTPRLKPVVPPSTKTPIPPKTVKPRPKPIPPKTKLITVQKGDTLTRIANRHKMSLTELKKLNPTMFNAAHRNGNLIKPGEKVRVRV